MGRLECIKEAPSQPQGTSAAAHSTATTTATATPAATAPPVAAFSFAVHRVSLDVSIHPGTTSVTSVVEYQLLDAHHLPARPAQSPPSASSAPAPGQQALHLRGQDLELLQLCLDGVPLAEGSSGFTWDAAACELVVHSVPSDRPFTLQAVTATHPERRTGLDGLFCVGGVYATQCEATQFSLMTFFPDRPDVLSRWRVRVEADAATCPVLLSNGNRTQAEQLEGGRHFTVWEDPFLKPCYLFSLVAGDLALREGVHTTHKGRHVSLKIYAPAAFINQVDEAILALKAAMTWDEAAFGREYDLDTYTMVGLEGFNDDATESKGMSLFSVGVLAALPSNNTDEEVDTVRGLVAHEYFHNWSGNRVTLCDWHNLTVKEGLTVYREQQFMSDLDAAATAVSVTTAAPYGSAEWEATLLSTLYSMRAAAAASAAATSSGQQPAADTPNTNTQPSPWRRVLEASYLRQEQWPEDCGPLAHPIRPRGSASCVGELYTDTVYSKGAAVVRMFRVLLGPEGFQRGVQAFFDNNDGKAVPCEAFCEALCTANSDHASLLQRMLPWYCTPGTPTLTISSIYSPASESLTVTIKQRNDTAQRIDRALNKPLLIPVKIGLVGPDGQDMPLHLKTSSKHQPGSKARSSNTRTSNNRLTITSPEGVVRNLGLQGSISTSLVLLVDSWSQSFTFTRLPGKPCISLLRDFSAPVRLEVQGETDKSLGHLAVHDSNPFARWDALQRLLTRLLIRLYDKAEAHADSIQDMDSLAGVLASGGACRQGAAAAAAAAGGMPPALLAALEAALLAEDLDGEYQATLLQLPSAMQVAALLHEPDPELLWMVWVYVGQQLARGLQQQLQATISRCDAQLDAQLTPDFGPLAVKSRALSNAALGLLSFDWSESLQQQLLDRYHQANCMTDRLALLELLADEDSPARAAALQHFADTYRSQPLAMLKWLSVQAACDLEGNVQRMSALMEHPAFDITNPAACEHLLCGFAASVPNFHAEDGSGYAFMADAILKVDKVNPQMAARLVTTLSGWRAVDEDRQQAMRLQLQRIAGGGNEGRAVSRDVMALVERILGCC